MLLWETDLSYGIEAIAYYMMSKADDAAGDAYTKNKMIAYAGDFWQKRWNVRWQKQERRRKSVWSSGCKGEYWIRVFMQMRQSEQKLIEILIELFGMTSCDKIASCYEYSKISAVIGLWSSPLPEMRLMGKDLERPHSKKLVKAICETVELNETQLKKELYSLLHYVNENRCFVSSDHILNLHLDGKWEKCKGKVAPEVIEEGLHSRSDIMGECAVYMAAYNIETAGVRDLLISMLRTSSIETVVERAGRVLAACEEKNLAMYAEARLMDDAIPSYICLYDYLPKRVEDSAAENWLRIIRRGFMGKPLHGFCYLELYIKC